jgi:hypothetical protein
MIWDVVTNWYIFDEISLTDQSHNIQVGDLEVTRLKYV